MPDESKNELHSIFTTSLRPGCATEAKKKKTESGLKDLWGDHFVKKILAINLTKRGEAANVAIAAEIAKLKEKDALIGHLSPVWRIRGASDVPQITEIAR